MPLPEASRLPAPTSLGVRLDTGPEAFGELCDSTPALRAGDFALLRRRFAEDGYLRLRELLERERVEEAAARVAHSLALRRLLDPAFPPVERIAARGARVSKFGFEAEDRRFPEIRALALSGRMPAFYDGFLEARSRAFDYLWLRLMAPGQATAPHCDIVYMGRGTSELFTSWIPLTPVTLADGPLMMLERSHCIESIRNGYARMDIDRNNNWRRLKFRHGRIFRGGDYSRNPRRVQQEFRRRWLTAEFEPGDVLIFSPFTMHGALDNHSRRFRISVDARYQRAGDPIDERWIGPHPIAHSQAA